MTFLLLLFAIILVPFAHVKVTLFGLPLYLPEIAVALAAIFAWCFHSEGKKRLPDPFIVSGALIFVTGALLSAFANPLSLTSLGMLKSWFVVPVVMSYLFWCETRGQWQRQTVIHVWLAVLVFVAIRSLMLYFAGEKTYDGRLAGDYASPNFLALLLAPGILFSFSFFLDAYEDKKRQAMLFFVITAGVLSLALFLTRSYGAWVGTAGAILVLLGGRAFINRSWKQATGAIMLSLFLLVLAFFLDHGSEKWQSLLSHDPRSSLSSRLMIWQAAGKIITDHPILGIGVGRFQEEYLDYQRYFLPYLEWAVPEPHNLFLAVFLSTGLVGTLGFLLLVSRSVFRQFCSILRFAEQPDWARFSVLLLSVWALFFLYGLTDTPLFKNDLSILFFLTIALSALSPLKKKSPLV
jgi:O-antigen ligase